MASSMSLIFWRVVTENEMQIILVVFDKKSFQLSGQIVGEIDSYIDANYIRESHKKEYPAGSRGRAISRRIPEEELYEQMLRSEDAEESYPFNAESDADARLTESCMLSADISLEDQLANMGASFHEKLFDLIAVAGIDMFGKMQTSIGNTFQRFSVMSIIIQRKRR